jgi:pimeloyl-ACP methyl ester carboxylesterase
MHIIFIGGLWDNRTSIVKNYQKGFAKLYPNHGSEYFQWHQKKRLRERLRCLDEEIIMVGHSYGGKTATEVLRDKEIALLVTIDPVGRIWSNRRPLAKRWINVNAIPIKNDFSDYIALFGGKWGKKMASRADEYHVVECNHAGFFWMMEGVLKGYL